MNSATASVSTAFVFDPTPVTASWAALRRRKKAALLARHRAEILELQAAMAALKARHARELAELP